MPPTEEAAGVAEADAVNGEAVEVRGILRMTDLDLAGKRMLIREDLNSPAFMAAS